MSELTGGQVGMGDTTQAVALTGESKAVIRQALSDMAIAGGFGDLKEQAKRLIDAFQLVDAT